MSHLACMQTFLYEEWYNTGDCTYKMCLIFSTELDGKGDVLNTYNYTDK